ncbi:glyoxylate/hydroxypyruvate reductase A [Rhizobium sp. DKSPLA3]|uniref:Glyoxylate/hydroxypyruvate reductase A n=1 Tax=Rhizobium quercicola TaxID=2901226 RepID=A0A9X1NQE8_9HYPH|nr:glyoxylate/hydroxypyruvate reductase A [Rhizobium quercicola]MCD7107824.1 glyoxylate/hydroxypyruvate reductase A [Rhizobium quercicola]
MPKPIPVVLKSIPAHAAVWHEVFLREAPDMVLRDWDAETGFSGITYFAGWMPPADLAVRMPDLALVFSVGAGIDHLPLADIPAHVAIVRMIAPDVTRSMTEYVLFGVLALHRDIVPYVLETREGVWNPRPIRPARSRTIGIMGLGVLGRAAAKALVALGFRVRGWSQSAKDMPGVETFAGRATLDTFLAETDILVCLLPLTGETRHILDDRLFRTLPRGAAVLNVGRGGHLVEPDLLRALDDGHISAAILDVLSEEPPPADCPLLGHPRVLITPHSASASQPEEAARQMITIVRQHGSGAPIDHLVDRGKGF